MGGRMNSVVVAAALMLAAAPAGAQQIYKCANGSGGNTYQQTPCAAGKSTKQVYRYTPQPDSPRDYGQYYRQEAYSSQYRQQASSSAGGVIPPGGSGQGNLQERLRSIASDSAYKGRPSARQAAMNAAMQEAGIQPASPYQAPRVASPSDGIGLPVNAINERTGVPVNGAIKVAPNRIWDPTTGQYYDTHN